MTISEVAGFLGYSLEKTKTLVKNGVELPVSGTLLKLEATTIGGKLDVSDEQFDEFVKKFEAEEPGRWPPAAVRRELLVQAWHRCAICRQPGPPQYHHMLDWAKVKHHDPKHMLAICGTCHTRCTKGEIDYKAQVLYKKRLTGEMTSSSLLEDKKRESDLHTIRELFGFFPRRIVDQLLDEASCDRIHTEHIDVLMTAENILRSTLFHLNDTHLTELLRDFFVHWDEAWDVGRLTHHDSLQNGLATLTLGDADPMERWKDHKRFQEHVAQAQHAFASLTKHLHENYPDFDIVESDREAEGGYWEMVEEVKKRTEALWGKNAAEDGVPDR